MYIAGYHNEFDSYKAYESLSSISDMIASTPLGKFLLIGNVPECKEYFHAGVKSKRDTWTFFDNEKEATAHRDKYFKFWTMRELFVYRVPMTTDTMDKENGPDTDIQEIPAARFSGETVHPGIHQHEHPLKDIDR